MALQYFPEIHQFTSAEGISNYQSALIWCSTWISTCRSLCRHFKFHFSDAIMPNTSAPKWLQQFRKWWFDGGVPPVVFPRGWKGLTLQVLPVSLHPSSESVAVFFTLAAAGRRNLQASSAVVQPAMRDIFKGLVTQTQAYRLFPRMTEFGVGLEIIYSCDMILPGSYLEEKDVRGRALLDSLENTNSLSCISPLSQERGAWNVPVLFLSPFLNLPGRSAGILSSGCSCCCSVCVCLVQTVYD